MPIISEYNLPRGVRMRYKYSILVIIISITLSGCAHLAQEPKDSEARASTAIFDEVSELVGEGNIEEAIQTIERHLQAYSVDQHSRQQADLRILHARLLLQAGQSARAQKVLTVLLDENPSRTEALFTLSMLKANDGDEKEQRKLLEEILKIDPNHVDALTSFGDLHSAAGQLDRAENSYLEALKNDSESFPALMGIGQVSLKRKDYPAAEEYFDRTIAIVSDFPFAFIDRAYCRKAQGNFTGAAEDLSKAIELDPDYYWNYIDRGRLNLLMSQKTNAERDFLQAARIDGEHFLAYVYLAGICYKENRWNEALQHYTRLVTLKRDYYFAYKPLGVLHYGFGNWEKSIRYFAKAHDHDPAEHAYLLMTALALKRLGKAANAAEYLRERLHRIPQAAWHYEVARYLIRPEYVSPVLSRVNREKNPEAKKRMSFYIASQYLISGQITAAKAILVDLTVQLESSHIESILTQWELSKLKKGS